MPHLMVNTAAGAVKCKLVERHGFNHDAGMQSATVSHDGKERTVVRGPDGWRFWTEVDRTAPLREGVAK
jgi:hypothetical protein